MLNSLDIIVPCFAGALFSQVSHLVYFVNTNLPKEHPKNTLNWRRIKKILDNSTIIFIKNILDRYMDQLNHSFFEGKYIMLDSFWFAEFISCYTFICKPKKVHESHNYKPDA